MAYQEGNYGHTVYVKVHQSLGKDDRVEPPSVPSHHSAVTRHRPGYLPKKSKVYVVDETPVEAWGFQVPSLYWTSTKYPVAPGTAAQLNVIVRDGFDKTLPSAGDICVGVPSAGVGVGFVQFWGPSVALVITYPYGVWIMPSSPDADGVGTANVALTVEFGAGVGVGVDAGVGCGVGVAVDTGF